MKSWRKLFLTGALFAVAAVSSADAPKASSAAWLDLGIGARALGMGGAVSSLVDDASAVWWNPAGLSQMAAKENNNEFFLDGNILTENRELDHIGYAHRTDGVGSFGVGLTHYALTGLEGYDDQGNPTANFQDMGLALHLAWASEVNWHLRYGVAARVLHQELGPESALGWAGDVGVLYFPFEASPAAIAVTAQNLVSNVHWTQGTDEETDPTLRMGLSDRPLQDFLTLSADVEIGIRDGTWVPHVGAELWATQDWAIRTGWQPGQGLGGGLTWKVSYYVFDYGFGWDPLGLGQRHEVSVAIKI
jgi:hypothetical protein